MRLSQIITFSTTYLQVRYLRYLSVKKPSAFARWQKRRLEKHVKRIVKHSSYYRNVLSEKTFNDYPIINKQVMMEHFDDLNTAGISLNRARVLALMSEQERDFSPKIGTVSVGLSSGTTGNQGVFLVSDHEVAQWAAAVTAKLIDFKQFRKEPITIAFFMRANNNLYESMNKGKININFFDLLKPVKENLERLMILQPNIIVAQPSMLRIIADYFDGKTLPFELKEVYSIAEVLDPVDEMYISERLGLPIKQVYQATEGFLAASCSHGYLHLNEDVVYIEKEYLDAEKRRFVPIITDLYRISQPLIRYRLNDVLIESQEPCPCGSCYTRIDAIEGREDDCFVLKNQANEMITIFPDFIRYAIINADAAITEYKVSQNSATDIIVYLNITDDDFITAQQTIHQNFADLFASYGITEYLLQFENAIPESKNKKLRRIERML
ncbi:F390 synthetase-related protein [Culicoidibacter larvae]|uniref:F390 synthetase-related protein n=1 Tax=Culicoidibacter larvae TaxID=2579976 RepID=UPI0024113D63|nr:F390 synthetase-related protein [Culicoidibacter larvae]